MNAKRVWLLGALICCHPGLASAVMAEENGRASTPQPAAAPAKTVSSGQPAKKTTKRLEPGTHLHTILVDEVEREFLVHVPRTARMNAPTPIVLALHGAMMNARAMPRFCGLNEKAEKAGFIVVYPNGSGTGRFRVWNAGGLGKFQKLLAAPLIDDVKYISKILDELPQLVSVDPDRVYATGLSNGGMMCYRLASELSERIAAIAPVAGTMITRGERPARPISVIHFHGDEDGLVPFEGPKKFRGPTFVTFRSVAESMETWRKFNDCPEEPRTDKLPDAAEDGTTVARKTWGPGREKTEVVLYEISGGGHTWPGRDAPWKFLGRSTKDIDANDLIWEFFQKHSRKAAR